MSIKHARGPFSYNFDAVNKEWRVIGAQGYATVCEASIEANAQRIVACLNYCEGVSTTQIESAAGLEIELQEPEQAINSIHQQYDAMAEALGEALNHWQESNDMQEDEEIREQDRQRLAQIRNKFLTEFAARQMLKTELVEALSSMISWAIYLDECDPWYASEDIQPGFDADLAKARLVLTNANALLAPQPPF